MKIWMTRTDVVCGITPRKDWTDKRSRFKWKPQYRVTMAYGGKEQTLEFEIQSDAIEFMSELQGNNNEHTRNP